MATIAEALQTALAHYQGGRLSEAEAAYREILARDPRNVEALNNLGNVLGDRGQFEPAAVCYEQALAVEPGSPYVHFNLGNALRAAGAGPRALASYRQALALLPNFVACHNNLGRLQRELGDLAGAQRSLEQALRLDPNYFEAHCNLALVWQGMGDLAGARASGQRSIELRPDSAEAHYNLGIVCQAQGDSEAARRHFQEALRIHPLYAQPLCHLGIRELMLGEYEAALAHFEQALAIDPSCPEAHFNRGLMLLSLGDYAAGWPEYEWRSRCAEYDEQTFDRPPWDGSPLAGRRLLIHCNRGLGDTLQMARYAALARQRGAGKVLVAAPVGLHPLLAEAGIRELVPLEARDLEFDVYVHVMDVPCVFRSTDETIPPAPYLRASAPLVAKWRERLSRLSGFRVGIAWQGNRKYTWDRLRSIPLAQFAPLTRVSGVRLISLQKGEGCEQLPADGFAVTELPESVDRQAAFMDTAAIIANLDLVITSDSAIAHLAGALGAPVWVALSRGADWRWPSTGDTTAWYPSMRLFRQLAAGDWASIFNEMSAKLESMMHQRQAAADE